MPLGQSADIVVKLQGVSKRFGGRLVLSGVDLRVGAGEAVAVVGENGAGKSTLLRICAGLVGPTSGVVAISGRVGYCPQDAGLLELLTADEHLVVFGRAAGMSRDRALAEGWGLLAELGFRDGTHPVRHLSGGNRQKLNLALALLGGRSVLLLDEPYQGFDHGTYVNFWDHVDAWRRAGSAVIIVTHLLTELDRVDSVLELHASIT